MDGFADGRFGYAEWLSSFVWHCQPTEALPRAIQGCTTGVRPLSLSRRSRQEIHRRGRDGAEIQAGSPPLDRAWRLETPLNTNPSLLILTVGTATKGDHSNLAQGLVNTLRHAHQRAWEVPEMT